MNKLLTSFVLIILISGCKKNEPTSTPPPPKVSIVGVEQKNVALDKEFVGQVYGKVDIPIRARVEGFLEGIHFEEGRPVKKNQLLYTIDPAPFQQAVSAAESRLASANTELIRATNDLDRIRPLTEMNALSERELDAAIASKEGAEAMVDAAEAGLKAEQINLGYTKIYSPIHGIIGKTNAKVGEFVGRDPNPVILNTISRVDSIRVEFFITENDYLQLARQMKKDRENPNKAQNTEGRPLKLILSDGSLFPYDGKVDFVDRNVGTATGSILIQSSFPNPEKLIKPGQFAKIRVTTDFIEDGLLVPQRCVSEFQGNFFVYKLNESNHIEQTPVQITGTYQDYYLVGSGLSKGDKIVFEGLQLVKSGMAITPKDTVFQSQFETSNE